MATQAWGVATLGMRRRGVLRTGLAFAGVPIAAASAACGGAGGDQKAAGSALDSQKNATMEAWTHADTRSAWQKLTLEDYNKEKGRTFTVNWTKLGSTSEVVDKLVVTLAAGSGFPDLCDVEISQMGKLLKAGTPPLVAYNEYLKGKESDFFKPSFIDPWSLNGKYYGLGNELNAVLFAYRYDLFERAGIKTPVKTWDEAIDAGKRLTGTTPDGLFYLGTGFSTALNLLGIQGGGGYLDKGSKLQINHTANLKALQFWVDMVYRHKAVTLDPPGTGRKDGLNTGRVAGEPGATWRVSGGLRTDAPDTDGKWMVQLPPQWTASGKLTTTAGGTGMTVLKDSKYKDAGVDYVVWEHSNKTVLHDYDLRQVWPTYKKVYDDPRLNEPIPWFNNQRVGPVLKEAADNMLPFFQGVWWPEINTAAGKHLKSALANEKPAKQALDDAQSDAKAAIEAGGGKVDADGTIRQG